jgi:hypothetical protein
MLFVLHICLEKGSEIGIPFCSMINNLLNGLPTIFIPCDILLAREVDLKLDDIGNGTVHEEMKKAPNALTKGDVGCIQRLFDFIIAGSKLHADALMTLVHILVDVLDRLDKGDELHIDVAIVLQDEVGTVSDNPVIVNLLSMNAMCLSGVMMPG